MDEVGVEKVGEEGVGDVDEGRGAIGRGGLGDIRATLLTVEGGCRERDIRTTRRGGLGEY